MVEYPIIEPGTVIEFNPEEWPIDVVIVQSMFADEDGNVQLQIDSESPHAIGSASSITLNDLHERLESEEYKVAEA